MPEFKYKAIDGNGSLSEGVVEAEGSEAAARTLRGRGLYPFSIGRPDRGVDAGARLINGLFKNRSLSASELERFTHALKVMAEAGLTLDRSLSVIEELERGERLSGVAVSIRKGVREGANLADAMDLKHGLFPDFYINAVRAGEAAGSLEESLSALASYLDESAALKEQLASALIYPAMLFSAGLLAVAAMLVFVVPSFASVFAEMNAAMPLPARGLIFVSGLLRGYWWGWAALLAAAAALLKLRLASEGGRAAFEEALAGMPFVGPVIVKTRVSRFARTLGMLLKGGLPLLDALKVSSRSTGSAAMESKLVSLMDEARRGRGIAAPLREMAVFPPLALNLISVGEETGRLEEMLIKLSNAYDREVKASLKRLLSFLEPAVILVMAVVVGLIVVSLLLAVLSLNDLPM